MLICLNGEVYEQFTEKINVRWMKIRRKGREMTKKQRKMLMRIGVAFLLYVVLLVLKETEVLEGMDTFPFGFLLYLIPYLVIGWDILWKAVRNIRNGQVFDENFLMTIATFGAFGVQEYAEAVAVMLFYQIGEWFQSYAVNRSRTSITELMDICPEYANIEKDGELTQVDPYEVTIGTIITVKPGERIPLDGIVVEGHSMVDTSALTGESVPRKAEEGTEIISGCINGNGILRVRVTKEFEDSTVTKILELVENASSKKAKVENFITRFAKYYTPVVVIAAAVLAVFPPILIGGEWSEWIQRACIFLVISCPCALVISVPLSFFGGIGAASKAGALVKGSNYLEAMADVETVVFDKTGTLTKGEFKVAKIWPEEKKERILKLAALAESYSDHPIAQSVREAYAEKKQGEISGKVCDIKEISGCGICAVYEGKELLAGNERLMREYVIDFEAYEGIGTVVYVALDGMFEGTIVISDSVKDQAKETLKLLKSSGVRKTVMLTGDKKETAYAVAEELGIDEVYAELMPGDKVEQVERLIADLKRGGSKEEKRPKLAFVGDGINDAPVLGRADVGIAMGSMGSDAAIEAADIVLMDDDTSKIAKITAIARKTIRIVRQNIIFALAVKVLVLLLGAFGMANMWEAVFADVGVAVIAILNAMRALKLDGKK